MALTVTLVEDDDILCRLENGKMYWFRTEFISGAICFVRMADAEVTDWHSNEKAIK